MAAVFNEINETWEMIVTNCTISYIKYKCKMVV